MGQYVPPTLDAAVRVICKPRRTSSPAVTNYTAAYYENVSPRISLMQLIASPPPQRRVLGNETGASLSLRQHCDAAECAAEFCRGRPGDSFFTLLMSKHRRGRRFQSTRLGWAESRRQSPCHDGVVYERGWRAAVRQPASIRQPHVHQAVRSTCFHKIRCSSHLSLGSETSLVTKIYYLRTFINRYLLLPGYCDDYHHYDEHQAS